MKKQIVRVSLLHNAKLMAVIYCIVSVPLVALMTLPMLMQEGAGASLLAIVFLPLLYTAFGFVLTLFGAWVYNGIAARIGGFEFTTVEVGKD
jgi:hypothetical protein